MGRLAAVQKLNDEIADRLPDAKIVVDEPSNSRGVWWIDVKQRGHRVSIEFRPGRGYGISGPRGGYGEGPDIVVNDPATAAEQVVALLVTNRLRDEWPSSTEWSQHLVAAVSNAIQDLVDSRLAVLQREMAQHFERFSNEMRKLEYEISEASESHVSSVTRSQKTARKAIGHKRGKTQRKESSRVRR